MNITKFPCPGCSQTLEANSAHPNVLYCCNCNSYSYYNNGIVNKNVFFGLVRSRASEFNGLKEILVSRLSSSNSLFIKQRIRNLKVTRFLVPVRMVEHNGRLLFEPMIDISADQDEDNKEIYAFMEKYIYSIHKLFSFKNVIALRLDLIKDEIDKYGVINKTFILPETRSKRAIDQRYNIPYDEMVKILYIPIYRLNFGQERSLLCFGDDKLTGLDESVIPLLSYNGSLVSESAVVQFRNRMKLSAKISLFFSLPLSLYYVLVLCGSNPFIIDIVLFVIALIIIEPFFTILFNIIISTIKLTVKMIVKGRQNRLRRYFSNLFDYRINCNGGY